MDTVDRDLEKAERDASPERFPAPYNEPNANKGQEGGATRKVEEVEEVRRSNGSISSSSSSSISSASVTRQDTRLSRVNTSRDLERHPTALSRIATQRSQHQSTVGRSEKSRESKKALPNFGAGKPYPPALPAQEEYVVEFDGPDDPLHPQNWPLKKK